MSFEVHHQAFYFAPQELMPADVSEPTWQHNPLHDVDSVWWISIWATLSFMDKGTSPTSQDLLTFQRLFNSLSMHWRAEASKNPNFLNTNIPSYNQPIWNILVRWRNDLTRSFRTSEAGYLRGDAQPTEEIVLDAFRDAIAHLEQITALGGINADVSRKYL